MFKSGGGDETIRGIERNPFCLSRAASFQIFGHHNSWKDNRESGEKNSKRLSAPCPFRKPVMSSAPSNRRGPLPHWGSKAEHASGFLETLKGVRQISKQRYQVELSVVRLFRWACNWGNVRSKGIVPRASAKVWSFQRLTTSSKLAWMVSLMVWVPSACWAWRSNFWSSSTVVFMQYTKYKVVRNFPLFYLYTVMFSNMDRQESILWKSNTPSLIHSVPFYFGSCHKLTSKRMAVVVFWKAGS